MHPHRPALVLLLLAGAVGGSWACAEPPPDGDADSVVAAPRVTVTPESAFRARLGVTWELARLDTHVVPPARPDGPAPVPGRHPGPGSRPTIRFTDERHTMLSDDPRARHAEGWSVCNGYGTPYVVGPGDQLRFGGVQGTAVGCDGPDSLETRFFRGLARTSRFELDSTSLRLLAEDGSGMWFVPARRTDAPPGR